MGLSLRPIRGKNIFNYLLIIVYFVEIAKMFHNFMFYFFLDKHIYIKKKLWFNGLMDFI